MPVLDSELTWYRAENESDTDPANNGGRVDFARQSLSDAADNLFVKETAQDRSTGVVRWRKAFIAVRNADNLALLDPRVSIESGTPGDSVVTLYPGTQDDTEDEITGRPYGYATLAADATLGATEITATTEADWSGDSAADQPFQVGDTLRIDSRDTVADSGSVDYATIATVSYSGTALTLGLEAGLTHAYTAADGVHVASVIRPGTVSAGYESLSVSNAGASTLAYAPSGGNLVVPNIGGIRRTWTITVTDAASGAISFTDDTGTLTGTGALGSTLQPANPLGGRYFILLAAGWSGTPADGDELTFTAKPPVLPIWYRRAVPAGSASLADDPVDVCIEAESA